MLPAALRGHLYRRDLEFDAANQAFRALGGPLLPPDLAPP